MYNIFKNKVVGALCYSYVKDSFRCFCDEYDIEEIYYSNDRLFVVVKNKTIGKKLRNVREMPFWISILMLLS